MVVGAAFVLGVLVAYGTLGGGFVFFTSPPYLAKESNLFLANVLDELVQSASDKLVVWIGDLGF